MRKPTPFWKHFGLKRNPFGLVEGADDVFESREMGRIMDHLAEAVEEGGIFSVDGERGIGKTTARHEIIQFLEENRNLYAYSIIECMDPKMVTMSTIMTALVTDLSSETPKQNTEHRSRQARRIIGEQAATKRVVLLIDEAQRYGIKVLEHLKMLTEMHWGLRTRLITVVLFGQPELISKLKRDKGLYQRVTQYHMRGLTEDEVLQYIDLRCRAAKGSMNDIFDQDALMFLAQSLHSPLHINHVCSSAMRAAKRVGAKKVGVEIIYGCEGIRSPRQVLRDAGLSIGKFAEMVGVRSHSAAAVLDGKGDDMDPEKRERIRSGFQDIVRGQRDQEPARSAG